MSCRRGRRQEAAAVLQARRLEAMLGLEMCESVLIGTEFKGRTFRITCTITDY